MFKDALHTGRIYKQTWTIHDAVPKHHSAYNNSTNTDFSSLVRALGQDEWISFQNQEKVWRKMLASKHFEDRLNFVFSGETPTKWIKLICILNGVYFKNGIFSITWQNGRPFGLPFLKFTTRVLKKMPLINRGLPQVQTRDSLEAGLRRSCASCGMSFSRHLERHVVQLQIKSRWAKINWHIYGKIEKLKQSKLFLMIVNIQVHQPVQIASSLCKSIILPNVCLKDQKVH